MESDKDESFTFPSCWNDDMRMNSLFAPFRARSINPTDWDSKMKFWESLLEQWCIYHKSPFVELSLFCDRFRRNDKTPSCLPEVFEYLQRNKTLVSKETFSQMTELSWKNWAVQVLISNPMKWTLNKVKSTVIKAGNDNSILIHMSVVKKLAEQLLEKVPDDCKGKLISMKYVQNIANIKNVEAMELILQWLCSQKLIVLHQQSTNLLVKFPKTKGDVTISDVDKALYSLESNKDMLQSNIDRLEKEREKLIEEARKNVAEKKMITAKANLRRKKTVENVIQKISDGITNIDNVIYQMQMAEMNSVILDCYKTGVTTLKKYFADAGLTKERVTETKNELEEILSFKSDIDDILSGSIDGQVGESNEDLEKELELLLEVDKKEKTDSYDIGKDLPDVPVEDPNESVVVLEKKLAELAL